MSLKWIRLLHLSAGHDLEFKLKMSRLKSDWWEVSGLCFIRIVWINLLNQSCSGFRIIWVYAPDLGSVEKVCLFGWQLLSQEKLVGVLTPLRWLTDSEAFVVTGRCETEKHLMEPNKTAETNPFFLKELELSSASCSSETTRSSSGIWLSRFCSQNVLHPTPRIVVVL